MAPPFGQPGQGQDVVRCEEQVEQGEPRSRESGVTVVGHVTGNAKQEGQRLKAGRLSWAGRAGQGRK